MDSHYFMQEWAIPRLAILFDHGAKVNVLHECRQITPLYFVMIRLKNLSIAQFLVENGADPNFEADICPILCDYIRLSRWSSQATRFLLEIGTDPNQYDNKGWTPLMVAIHYGGDEETVHTLLKYGADPLLRSRTEGNREIIWSDHPYYDMSALEVSCCAETSSRSLLEKILRCIPAHKYTTENLQRPLYFACANGHLSSVELILDTIPPEEFKSHLLQGALYLACYFEEVDIIMCLVKRIVE
jgi:ankyrin repeat protein